MPIVIGPEHPDYPSPYIYARCRRLEGTYPEDAGCWDTTLMRLRLGWGTVTQADWATGQDEPPGVDERANKARIDFYARVRSSDEAESLLKKKIDFYASFEIWDQWYTAEDGIITEVPEHISTTKSHNVHLIDYLHEYDTFVFANSWGLSWGQAGLGMMTRHYFDSWLVDSWLPYKHHTSSTRKGIVGRSIVQIPFDSIGTNYVVGVVNDGDPDDRKGWYICCEKEGFLEVEELYVKPELRRLGYGKLLMMDIAVQAALRSLPIRLWIPYVDCYSMNHSALLKVASFFKLKLHKTTVPWAGYVGVRGPSSSRLPLIRIPGRPQSNGDEIGKIDPKPLPPLTDDMEQLIWRNMSRRAQIRQALGDD